MATRKDVAELAGVSPSMVSYVINNSGYVSQKKREAICDAIEKLQYRPNMVARSLKVKSSKQLVLICNEIRNPFHAEITYQMAKKAYEKGYILLFCNVINDPKYIETICSYQVDGVFVVADKLSETQVNRIAGYGIPVVSLVNMRWDNLDEHITKIDMDTYSGMSSMIAYLIERGHTNIKYISSCPSKKLKKYDSKIAGYIDQMQKAGLPLVSDSILYDESNGDSLYEKLHKMFEADTLPTAFACCNDSVAISTMHILKGFGKRIPEDISVTGFDDTRIAQEVFPALSTVNISIEQISQVAVDAMLNKIQGIDVGDITVKTGLVIRGSTK